MVEDATPFAVAECGKNVMRVVERPRNGENERVREGTGVVWLVCGKMHVQLPE